MEQPSAYVTNPEAYPERPVEPSPGLLSGQKFVSAFGTAMPNLGQLNPQVFLESGDAGALNYQAAKVKKPLMAVTDCNKRQNPVIFDGHHSCILPSNCPQLAHIRQLIQEATKKIPLHWEKGVYKMKTWIKPRNAPFAGQGHP